ncbi:MAG: hypothetical protein CL609_12010 [Anaerolineaceae bacterium]|nr:hypothetical protein [Anaerolineaceae bacterium]
MKSKKIIKITKWIWITAVIIGGGYYIINNWDKMIQYFNLIPTKNLFYSALFLLAGKLFLVFFSKIAVEKENHVLPYWHAFRIVSITQLGKYVPGGIWHFVGRYNAYHDQNLTIKKSTRALISENVWLLSGALVIGSLFGIFSQLGQNILLQLNLPLSPFLLYVYAGVIIGAWIVGLVVYEWFFINKKIAFNLLDFIKLILIQFATWVLLGISFSFVLPDLQIQMLPNTIFGYSISWVVGYIMIFAPGGIGIREGALVWIFSGLFPTEEIIIYSTVHRFLFVVVEIVLGSIAGIQNSKQKLFNSNTQPDQIKSEN